MPKKPEGSVARTRTFSLRWRPESAAALDRLRGDEGYSPYLERLVLELDQKENQHERKR